MAVDIPAEVEAILDKYDPLRAELTARNLRQLWLGFQPKSLLSITASDRTKQENAGISLPVLTAIGNEAGKAAAKDIESFIPLVHCLWDEFGREGRIVGVIVLGKMELKKPDLIVPLAMELGRSCHTWEDADQLAMKGVEPIFRKDPQSWLPSLPAWLDDENKWVRRVGITVAGRLPMKHPSYTSQCIDLIEDSISDEEEVVQKAASFAIRICARGDPQAVLDFLEGNVPPSDRRTTWVLCDVIRSMAKSLLPLFLPLLGSYEEWLASPQLSASERRSITSAITTLAKSQ